MIDRNTQDILHELRTPDSVSRLDAMAAKIDAMAGQIETLNKLLRQRSGRSKKLGN
jgi:hypothetical protein